MANKHKNKKPQYNRVLEPMNLGVREMATDKKPSRARKKALDKQVEKEYNTDNE